MYENYSTISAKFAQTMNQARFQKKSFSCRNFDIVTNYQWRLLKLDGRVEVLFLAVLCYSKYNAK